MSARPDHLTDHVSDPAPTVADHDRPAGATDGGESPVLAGTPVVVSRHAGLAALVGAAASAVAIAYLWRASQTASGLDWALFGAMSLIAAVYLAALVDARTPLLVADDLGVRVRLGHEWRGLPWGAIAQVVVHPRRGVMRDGRLVLTPHSLARALDGLDAKARRHVTLNQSMYGAALAVPLGATTRVTASGEHSVADQVAALAHGRADVVELDPRTLEVVDRDRAEPGGPAPAEVADQPVDDPGRPGAGDPSGPDDSDVPVQREVFPAVHDTDTSGEAGHRSGPDEDRRGEHSSSASRSVGAPDPDPADDGGPVAQGQPGTPSPARPLRLSILGGIGTIVSRVAKGRANDVDGDLSSPPLPPEAEPAPAPLRETRRGLRAEATLDAPLTAGTAALDPAEQVEGRELRRPGSVDLVFERVDLDDRVRPISTLGDPVEPLVIDDYATEPAYDPVIGPELTAARTRLGISVDALAERTRIRPHVIESIEVDDFAPCGGDFYARGHLRTLARILGKDPAPLLRTYEERYASAPVNARRVFEAELATGTTGSIRSTVGGPSWGLLVGVVLSLVLVWGMVRVFTTEAPELVELPAPALEGSAVLEDDAPVFPEYAPVGGAVEPVTIRLTASQADSRVVVRDGEGRVVFTGEMVLGERKTLRLAPPVRVRAADGGAVEVRVDGRDRGLLGEAGEPARRTFR